MRVREIMRDKNKSNEMIKSEKKRERDKKKNKEREK